MKQITKFMTMALLVLTLMPVAVFAAIELGQQAPDFTLKDSNGAEVSLSDYAGKYVVLEWFNPQCPFVRKHYDTGNMQGLQEKFTGQDVVWLSISSSAEGKQGFLDQQSARSFVSDEGAKSTAVLLDYDGVVGKTYGAQTTPHMFIIDPKGSLIYEGAIDDLASTDKSDVPLAKNYIDDTLSEALSGEQIVAFATKSYGCSVKY